MRIKVYITLGKIGPDGDERESIVSVWLTYGSADLAARKIRGGRVERFYATKGSTLFPAIAPAEHAQPKEAVRGQ